MIPSTNSKLLVAEDWKKVYQSFKNSDFKSYDFETLRRTMISYLREKYPEDFNDYIESSEYVALIDLIAYLGQNLSFRVDLNARENFLETAQRRDSILRLAQLINYNAKRNTPANGFLKLTAVSTTDNVFDANGSNLANTVITWNDVSNTNWYQQFVTIINGAMPGSVTFGKPYDKKTINGIPTEQYKLNTANSDVPVFGFNKTIGGISMPFEITSCEFTGKTHIYESIPKPADQFSFIFRNDSKGSASANTGFFAHFRQGTLNLASFGVDAPVPNEIVGINASNINDNDVWLWQLDADGNYDTSWSKVQALSGNNVIYNSLSNQERNIFAVTTRENDQVDLNFADGLFGNLPKGQFVLFYRQSNGLKYSVKPEQINGVQISLPYFNKIGQKQQLSLTFSLQYTINNSESAESDANIKLKAPQSFYTQNRMITAEDYNIAPLTAGADIVKIKSVNRISSGISKYYELSDVSGKYSGTNIFGEDGALYQEDKTLTLEFSYANKNEIYAAVINKIIPIAESASMNNFYLNYWPRPAVSDPPAVWTQSTKSTNQSTGYFKDGLTGVALQTGIFAASNLSYLEPGALVKFVPPQGKFFLPNGNLTTVSDSTTKDFKWVKTSLIIGDGSYGGQGNLPDGTGPVIVTQNIPSNAIAREIIPPFDSVFSYSLQTDIVNLSLAKRNFGLSFAEDTRSWYVINDTDLDLTNPFTILYQKDSSNTNKDASWLFAFTWTGIGYEVKYRITDYIFESEKDTSFYFDGSTKNYDFTKNTLVKDQISVLSTNPAPTQPNPATTSTVLFNTSTTVVTSVGTVSSASADIIPVIKSLSSNINFDNVTTKAAATVTSIISATTIVSTVTQVQVYTLFVSSATSATSTLTFALVPFASTSNYIAIHPNFVGGISTLTAVNTTSVIIANSLTGQISTTSAITFVPINIDVSLTANATHVTTATFDFISSIDYEFTQDVNLRSDYGWQIDGNIVEADGYIEPKKIQVSFLDEYEDNQIENPDAFIDIVAPSSLSPQTGFKDKFVYFKYADNNLTYSIVTDAEILAYPTEEDVPQSAKVEGQLFYFYDKSINVIKHYSETAESSYVLQPNYFAKPGRTGLKFQYRHNSGDDRRLDPSKTNLIDIFVLTQTYDTTYRNWLTSESGSEPLPPTSSELEENYSSTLEPIKAISDQLIYQPVKYKVLFGSQAYRNLQATFKAVRNSTRSTTENELKSRILAGIEQFFALENWEFGQTFYFSELSTYIMNMMSPDITNFIIVPKADVPFGSLYEIACQNNEIFINGAGVSNIEIIDAITANQIKTTATIINSTLGVY
jgi:hypothetical protein